MLPDFVHKPVMVAEVLAALKPRPGGRYADGTLGGAGHAAAILAATSPNGWLYGCDRDGVAVEAAQRRLARFEGRFELRRVDQRQTLTASSLVNESGADELAKLFWELGGERDARRLARAIVQARQQRPFETTRQLAELVERLSPRRGKKTHPATKIFQALRIAVNDEIGSLQEGLAGALRILKSGGRLAVITFYGRSSGERVRARAGAGLYGHGRGGCSGVASTAGA